MRLNRESSKTGPREKDISSLAPNQPVQAIHRPGIPPSLPRASWLQKRLVSFSKQSSTLTTQTAPPSTKCPEHQGQNPQGKNGQRSNTTPKTTPQPEEHRSFTTKTPQQQRYLIPVPPPHQQPSAPPQSHAQSQPFSVKTTAERTLLEAQPTTSANPTHTSPRPSRKGKNKKRNAERGSHSEKSHTRQGRQ